MPIPTVNLVNTHAEEKDDPLHGVLPVAPGAGVHGEAIGNGVDLSPPRGRVARLPPVRGEGGRGRARPAEHAEVPGPARPAGGQGVRRLRSASDDVRVKSWSGPSR